MQSSDKKGALVISLDFELIWGMRHLCNENKVYLKQLLKTREVIPTILDMFEEYNIAATWACVGFLFAKSRDELQKYTPSVLPDYKNIRLYPYLDSLGEGEGDDPLHYAPEIINLIQQTKNQEIATHTFSHYYCMEEGQTEESFDADLDSALAIANEYDIKINSIIFPAHQINHKYEHILIKRGITSYRGNKQHAIYQYKNDKYNSYNNRLCRLLDTYCNITGHHLSNWEDILSPSGLCNIPASRFLRPATKKLSLLNNLKINRILTAMNIAARTNKIFHLWWHPHNFSACVEENIKNLRIILHHYNSCQIQYGMSSLNMAQVSKLAK